MKNDNYKASPSSLVETPEPDLPERPRNVSVALALLFIALAIVVLSSLKDLQDAHFQVEDYRSLALHGADLLTMGVLIYLVSRAQGWARHLLLLLVLFWFSKVCMAVGFAWRRAPEMWDYLLSARYLLVSVLTVVLNLVALHLLYFASGNWFRKP